jgi:hypothetical protein
MESPAPVLPYADGVSDDGVAVVRYPDLLRVIVPPVRRLRDLGKGYLFGAIYLLYALVGTTAPIVFNRQRWSGDYFNAAFYAVASLLFALFAAERLRRRLVFEVTHSHFNLVFHGLLGTQRRTWPLTAIREARLNQFTKQLIVIRGEGALEIYLGFDAAANQRVADELSAAIVNPPEPSDMPAQRRSTPAPVVSNRLVATRRICMGISLAIIVLAIWAMMQVGIVAYPLLFFAAVPLGIAFGTQEKEYYI